jgi:RNA polymerase sigma-70 factor (ECF subfamily)
VNGLTVALEGSAAREAISQREFAALVHEHQSMVFSVALHYLGDRSAAEEVAQEVFLQLFRQSAKLTGPEHRTAWLRRVACHRAIDYARSRKWEPRTTLDEISEPAGESRQDDPMLRERLRKLIQSLPDKARTVMILRYQEDLDPEEIARTIDMPVRTVKSHLHRSLALLREKMGRALGENKV